MCRWFFYSCAHSILNGLGRTYVNSFSAVSLHSGKLTMLLCERLLVHRNFKLLHCTFYFSLILYLFVFEIFHNVSTVPWHVPLLEIHLKSVMQYFMIPAMNMAGCQLCRSVFFWSWLLDFPWHVPPGLESWSQVLEMWSLMQVLRHDLFW